MSNRLSICQGRHFFIGFPITISIPEILNWILLDSMRKINKLRCKTNLINKFVITTRHQSVSCDNGKITPKEKLKYFGVTTPTVVEM